MLRFTIHLFTIILVGCFIQVHGQSITQETDNLEIYQIEDLAFLAGNWIGNGFDGVSVEIWSKPTDRTIMGMYKHSKDGKVTFMEFCTIMEDSTGIVLRLKHFSPELQGWEEKDKYQEFSLLNLEPGHMAEFEGLKYVLVNNDSLVVSVNGTSKNGPWSEEFHFKRR